MKKKIIRIISILFVVIFLTNVFYRDSLTVEGAPVIVAGAFADAIFGLIVTGCILGGLACDEEPLVTDSSCEYQLTQEEIDSRYRTTIQELYNSGVCEDLGMTELNNLILAGIDSSIDGASAINDYAGYKKLSLGVNPFTGNTPTPDGNKLMGLIATSGAFLLALYQDLASVLSSFFTSSNSSAGGSGYNPAGVALSSDSYLLAEGVKESMRYSSPDFTGYKYSNLSYGSSVLSTAENYLAFNVSSYTTAYYILTWQGSTNYISVDYDGQLLLPLSQFANRGFKAYFCGSDYCEELKLDIDGIMPLMALVYSSSLLRYTLSTGDYYEIKSRPYTNGTQLNGAVNSAIQTGITSGAISGIGSSVQSGDYTDSINSALSGVVGGVVGLTGANTTTTSKGETLEGALGGVITDVTTTTTDTSITIEGEATITDELEKVDTTDTTYPVLDLGGGGGVVLPSGLMSKFPFCVPYDLILLVKVLLADGKAPYWQIPVKFASFGIDTYIELDMSRFDSIASICRWLETFGFIGFLIIKTRTLIRG